MSTIYCCEKMGKIVKGCQQAFTQRPKHGVRGSWAAVTFKSKPVPSLRVRQSKKVGLIGCPKMLLTNYRPTLSNILENKVLNYTAVEAQNLAWVIRVKKWTENDFFHFFYYYRISKSLISIR